MANDDSGKFLVALFVIAILILGAVSISGGATGSSILNNIFGGVTSLTGGSGGSSVTSGGTIIGGNNVIVPASVISFKTSIVADYADNTSEVIYQQSSLPGLAVISIHGKPIRDVTALQVVALGFAKPAPPGTQVDFAVNMTDQIEGVGQGWWFREIETPLVANNSLAIMTFPPVSVLPTDIFPAGQSLTSNIQRRVTWVASVIATVTPPPGYSLSLIPIDGSTASFAEINGDFSLGGGCTDCGGTGSTGGGSTGGSGTSSIIKGGSLEKTGPPPVGCTSNCNSVTVGDFNLNTFCNVGNCQGTPPTPTPPTPTPPPTLTVSSGTLGTGGTVGDGKDPTKQQTVTREVVKPLGPGGNGSPGTNKNVHPISLVVPGCDLSTGSSSCGLPSMNYTYLTNPLTGQTYMVNPLFAGLLIFLGLAFVVAAVAGSDSKKK